jgi:hypothetical protein
MMNMIVEGVQCHNNDTPKQTKYKDGAQSDHIKFQQIKPK